MRSTAAEEVDGEGATGPAKEEDPNCCCCFCGGKSGVVGAGLLRAVCGDVPRLIDGRVTALRAELAAKSSLPSRIDDEVC